MNAMTAHRGYTAWRALSAAAMAAVLASGLNVSASLAARDDGDTFVGDVPYVPTPQDVVDT